MRFGPAFSLTTWAVFLSAAIATPSLHAEISSSVPSIRAFDTQYLDRATLTANTLESLLNERMRRVINAAGIRAGDFSAAVTVHVNKVPRLKKGADPLPPPPKPIVSTSFLEPKKSPTDSPDFSSFQDHSLLNADDLVNRFESEELERLKNDRTPASKPDIFSDLTTEDEEPFTYTVNQIYAQAALNEKLGTDVRTQVEKALRTALDPIYPGHINVEVTSFAAYDSPWWLKALTWLQKLQFFAITILAILGAIFFLVLSRLIPSWQSRLPLRTAHEHKEELPPEVAAEEEIPVDDKAEETPPALPSSPPPNDDALLTEKIEAIQKDIVTFLNQHPALAGKVIADWGVNEEPASKISLCVELLSREGLDIGRVEFRLDQLKVLRDFKRSGTEVSLSERLAFFKEMFWDFVSAQHLAQETVISPFEFLNTTEEGAIFEAIQRETVPIKAQIIASINARRGAQILSQFPTSQKRQIMDSLVAGVKLTQAEILPVADRLRTHVKDLLKARSGIAKPSTDVLVAILRTMDFPEQLNACKGFFNLDAPARSVLLSSFFNVGLLPLAKDSFLQKIFVDRPTDNIRTLFNHFDETFANRVRELLPPMQKRMLEGFSGEIISNGATMAALRDLNELILGQIASREFSLADIFENGSEPFVGAFGGNANNENKAA